MPTFHIATFSADVTPPIGHPLCGGWIEPVRAVDDPLASSKSDAILTEAMRKVLGA